MSIGIVDTTVFCNILKVPNRSQDSEQALRELEAYIQEGTSLLLPMATVYETGNHIAQNGSGEERRQAGTNFATQVRAALRGESPFAPTLIHDADQVAGWLDDFPRNAMQGVGFGDQSIIAVWRRQCELHKGRRVFIWAYDGDLDGYDRPSQL